ncbi:uncharacterized protein BO97DRAFT_446502 [Aspergillus homomorphus CBS 101889]|uniref:Uncharacterized protein n=1 Tax=Aspergillus homomorphus (strain CBS 101889) TaxID=1450537 RepID=A0A395HJ17_ASPHC|nr:hypothetical protein BO97DRAFT_446502 [Aspergillus homomorphus CBS 101889]RAL07911.1 hypothetical protein BO97DRAFT_446502 [Aspergillus homomorphus CBS 101889]
MATAQSSALATVEILESILLHLDIQFILTSAQRKSERKEETGPYGVTSRWDLDDPAQKACFTRRTASWRRMLVRQPPILGAIFFKHTPYDKTKIDRIDLCLRPIPFMRWSSVK